MKIILSAIAISAALAAPAFAQDHAKQTGHGAAPAASAANATSNTAAAGMTAGEIIRIDTRSDKLTIRHEEIKNLDMPPMTMVFGLKDATLTAQFKPGDKVLFRAEEQGGTLVIAKIEAVK
ncbi:MAG: copper-binding protein [Comamonas sp.]